MDEAHFWPRLEFRVCAELRQSKDKVLRHLWCDGFDPAGLETDHSGTWIVGRAWIMGGDDNEFSFRLRVGDPGAHRPDADWSALVPPENTTAWLRLDPARKHIEVDPFSAIPDRLAD